MTNKNADEYRIEQFNLDETEYSRVSKLIATAFVDDTADIGGTISFDEETFHFMYGSPEMPKDLFIRAIHVPTGRMVGFLGGIPRNLIYEDHTYKFAVPSWASVHSKHQRHGLARRMGIKLMKIGQDRGYEGGFAAFEPEAHGIDAAYRISEEIGVKMHEILHISKFLIRVFDTRAAASVIRLKWYERVGIRLFERLKKVSNRRVRKFRSEDGDRVFELMQDHIDRNELAVKRDKKDFLWYLNQPGVNCVVHENTDDIIDGFLVAWKFNMAGFGHSVPFGWLDLVHTYRLTADDAADLCKYMCITAKDLGWAGLQSPYIPYFDPEPFKRARFLFFPKELIIGMFPMKNVAIPEKISSFYFDWR